MLDLAELRMLRECLRLDKERIKRGEYFDAE